MLKNMTIGKKLALGFGLVLVLLTLVGVISFQGVRSMDTTARDVIIKSELIENLTRKEVDHLNWANEVAALLTDDNVTELHVQTDDHKCAFGQWLYSDERLLAEQEIPSLAPILAEIEGYHRQLHESAIDIGDHFHQADHELPGIIAARMVDHLKWADEIRDAFLQNRTAVEVETDPTRCALGRWLQTEQAQNAYKNASADLKQAWDQMLVSHKKLHESAVDVCRYIGQAGQGPARARRVFDERTSPLLREILGHMEAMKLSADRELEGMKQANQVYVTKTRPCLVKVQELLNNATDDVTEVTTDTNENMLASAKVIRLSVSLLSGAAILLGIAAAVLIARSIIGALKQIIASLREGSEQVAAASGQVSAASQSLAEGATEQAAGLEETSSSLEEMSAMTRQNAENAQQANTLATDARQAASTGTESMSRMNDAIHDIQKSSDETAKIIKVIDEIAFQTNLLALNAAVEAARAGEAGKGFAVVAEEVRNLAMRSAEAAKNTAGMIEESVKNAKNGVDIAGDVGKALGEIVQGISKTTDLVSEIAAASQEQAQGIDQVNTAVAQMDKVTQQNAANAEESASASEELSAQAESMNDLVARLLSLVGGAATHTHKLRSGPTRPDQSGRSHQARFGRSDETWHEIAARSDSSAGRVKVSEGSVASSDEHAFPLDERDDRMDEFNR